MDATYKDLVSDPIAGQAMHPRSAEASEKQTNSGELRACSHDPGTTHYPGATH